MSILDALASEGKNEKRTFGVAGGIVTNNQDSDGEGRIKVKFPWLSDNNETDWVRIATLMAGGGRGSFFLPEVGDEVLVAFEHGDINRPLVIGFLWNGKDKPPEGNSDGKNNIRKITSRSGHEIIFDDNGEQQKEKIEIHTKAGHAIILNDSAGEEKIEIKDKGGSNSLVFDSAQKSITMESEMKLVLQAKQIEIKAGMSMTIDGGTTLTLQGTTIKIN